MKSEQRAILTQHILTLAERAYYRNPTDVNLARLKRAELPVDGVYRGPVAIHSELTHDGITFDGEQSFK